MPPTSCVLRCCQNGKARRGAAAGYRAVAIDVCGYGRPSKPAATGAYRMLDLVEDNVAVVRVFGEESAVVGHDWGSNIAAACAGSGYRHRQRPAERRRPPGSQRC